MASSVITAVQARWAAVFDQAGDPPLYFDEAPQTDAAGAQVRVPYAVLRDTTGLTPEYFSDHGAVETGDIDVELIATTVAILDGFVARAKWGGQAPSQKAGLDWFALSLTTSPRYQISLRRTNERRSYAGFDYQGARCHSCVLTYEVKAGVAAAGY
jgi:hypothetical protein